MKFISCNNDPQIFSLKVKVQQNSPKNVELLTYIVLT